MDSQLSNPPSSLLQAGPTARPSPALDVCHVGVVLRALLMVQGLVLLGLGLGAEDLRQLGTRFVEACTITVPALLIWLLVVCALRLRLAAWPPARLRWLLMALGALCAWLPWSLTLMLDRYLGGPAVDSRLQGAAVAFTGAAAAAALLSWMLLRARAQAPSELQARWVELQSRIRPHFLFNTLNTAVALVRVDPQQAERVLEDLAELFRAALSAPDWTATLADEVMLARRYLDIEQLRFGERLRIDWQLDPQCDRARLPPLLLQPLVENAVRYGVEPNEQGGEVLVRSRRLRSGEVELLVRNSLGAPAPGGHGLALANVRERLRLLHDVAAQFRVEATRERHTVRLILPAD